MKKILYIISLVLMTLVILFHLSDNNRLILGGDEAKAGPGCTAHCYYGLTETGGPDGTFRRECSSGCFCDFKWVKKVTTTTGVCDAGLPGGN